MELRTRRATGRADLELVEARRLPSPLLPIETIAARSLAACFHFLFEFGESRSVLRVILSCIFQHVHGFKVLDCDDFPGLWDFDLAGPVPFANLGILVQMVQHRSDVVPNLSSKIPSRPSTAPEGIEAGYAISNFEY